MNFPRFEDFYKIVRQIGEGGSSIVFLVEDMDGNKRAAKIPEDKCEDLLLDEAKAVAKFDENSQLLKYYGLFEYKNKPVLIMDYFEGETLYKFFMEEIETKDEALLMAKFVMREICKHLDYLHKIGITYCDIHSNNILISEENIVLIDFRTSDWFETISKESMADELRTDVKFLDFKGNIFKQICTIDIYNLADTI